MAHPELCGFADYLHVALPCLMVGCILDTYCCVKYERDMKKKSSSPEYACWVAMRQRCENKNNPRFGGYGGRGVTVCDRWSSFDAFIADMGPRPSSNHSIDRIDNDGNYEPSNCRWALPHEQYASRRPKAGASSRRMKKMVSFALDVTLLERLDTWLDSREPAPSKTRVLEVALREFLDRWEKRKR